MNLTRALSAAAFTLLSGCVFSTQGNSASPSGETPITPLQRLSTSRQQWERLKLAWDDTYHYRVPWQSAFGFGHTTMVHVQRGRVVRRTFESWHIVPGQNQRTIKERWQEELAQLGSNRGGALARTVDEMYDICEQILRQTTKAQAALNFTLDERGILQACHRTDRGIADDAPQSGVPYFQLSRQ